MNEDAYISTGDDILGYNMFTYCINNPVSMIDGAGCDPIPIWAKHIIAGTATEAEYSMALSVNAGAWVGSAGYTVRKAISLAQKHQLSILSAEHHKKGTTNESNRQKHEKGQARKQRDRNGEKGDARRRPNPNKRHSQNFSINISVDERNLYGAVAVSAVAMVVYLVANDITVVGIADDAAIAPLVPIIWDNAVKAFA